MPSLVLIGSLSSMERNQRTGHHTPPPEGPLLILGGTTEGRIAAQTCDLGSTSYFYSTKGESQILETQHGQRLSGAMDAQELLNFCHRQGVKLIIDAAHPFAQSLHANLIRVARQTEIPIIRFDRKPSEPILHPNVRYVATLQEALRQLLAQPVGRLLALTGVNSIPVLRPYWMAHDTLFRVMPLQESLATVRREEFPEKRLLFFKTGESYESLIEQTQPDLILTKESGESGLFQQKLQAAVDLNVPLMVIARPALPDGYSRVVYGPEGLRMAIQGLMPGFFPLHTGYTSGSCATAATRCALQAILSQQDMAQTSTTWISLPSGEPLEIPVAHVESLGNYSARACVVKNSGDDPDVTHGFSFYSEVTLHTDAASGGISIVGGEGVGRVTLPGLGIAPGEAAINATPRAMMTHEIIQLLTQYGLSLQRARVEVTISVPEGVAAAAKTYNPRLGIQGGISIIGSSGIVRPFSHEAFVASIRKSLSVAEAQGCGHVVLNSGAKSEVVLRALFPTLPPAAFIHYGNAIGDTLQLIDSTGITRVTVGLMIGKAVKLAEGALDTHSAKGNFNPKFLVQIAQEQGCTPEQLEAIANTGLARNLWDIIPAPHPFYSMLLAKSLESCRSVIHSTCAIDLLLIAEDGSTYPYP